MDNIKAIDDPVRLFAMIKQKLWQGELKANGTTVIDDSKNHSFKEFCERQFKFLISF